MKTMSYFVISFFMFLCTPLTHANAYTSDYTTLLSKYVKAGEKQGIKTNLIDYASWGNDPVHQKTLQALQVIDPNTLSGTEKMAFWINAYNLLTVDLIIKTGETQSIKNQGSLFQNVWKTHKWQINGKEYTLDTIEHKILRPMGEPRIHVAINCASLSCPDLRSEAYTASLLDTQLEDQTRLFLKNPTKGVLFGTKGIKVSKIFKWFSKDFDGKTGVKAFITSYLQGSSKKEIEGYLAYSWDLNSH